MKSVRRPRSLAEAYQRFGEAEAEASPLQSRVAQALSESRVALQAIETFSTRKRQPALVLAALHDLALSGRSPTLAQANAAQDREAAPQAAVYTQLTGFAWRKRDLNSGAFVIC